MEMTRLPVQEMNILPVIRSHNVLPATAVNFRSEYRSYKVS